MPILLNSTAKLMPLIEFFFANCVLNVRELFFFSVLVLISDQKC